MESASGQRRFQLCGAIARPELAASAVAQPRLRKVASSRLGELVMLKLKKLEKIAHIRFAGFYWSFEDINEFKTLVDEVGR